MHIRYRVELEESERQHLETIVGGGTRAVRRVKRAQILLAAAAGMSDAAIAATVQVGTSTVYRTKQHFVERGLERALAEAPRPGGKRKLAGTEEALLVATACAQPPAGRAHWTLALLASEVVRLTPHRSISRATVGRRLAENDLKPWQEKMWCVPAIDATYRGAHGGCARPVHDAPAPWHGRRLCRRNAAATHWRSANGVAAASRSRRAP
jgi:transposase